MQNLQLIPDIYRQHKIVKAVFDYNQELIPLVRIQKGAPWSQTQAQHSYTAHSIDRCMPFESTTLIQQPLYYTYSEQYQ